MSIFCGKSKNREEGKDDLQLSQMSPCLFDGRNDIPGLSRKDGDMLPGQDFRSSFDVSDSLPELPPLPQTGIPLQLVNRRPDVLSAFYQLQASDRELAAAISNKYPRLNFSITTAVRSNTFEGLLESQAGSLAGSLLAPLFYGRRLNAEVDRAKDVRQQLANFYGQTVLMAFQEVENTLIQEVKLTEQIEVMEEQLKTGG